MADVGRMKMLVLMLMVMVKLVRSASIPEISNHAALRGHQVWEVSEGVPMTAVERGLVDVLDHSGPGRMVRVAPGNIQATRDLLKAHAMTHTVLVDDLAQHLQEMDAHTRHRRDVVDETCTNTSCTAPLAHTYMTFQQMEWYLRQAAEAHPRAKLTSMGKSVEGRNLWLVHLPADTPDAPAVWIEGGIHAREWIAGAVALHVLARALEDDSTRHYDLYVAPMVNPDGYEYSRTSDRFWRKNRRVVEGSTCMGVDLNRNWDFEWGVSGVSSYACSEVYLGTQAFSEPETAALRDAMTGVGERLKVVLMLHSYGQQLLYPWGYTARATAPDTPEMKAAGEAFAEAAAKSSGASYEVVNSGADLYPASGASDDWAKAVLGTKYVYTLELRDKGTKAFALPPSAILPTSTEVWDGLLAMLDKAQ